MRIHCVPSTELKVFEKLKYNLYLNDGSWKNITKQFHIDPFHYQLSLQFHNSIIKLFTISINTSLGKEINFNPPVQLYKPEMRKDESYYKVI